MKRVVYLVVGYEFDLNEHFFVVVPFDWAFEQFVDDLEMVDGPYDLL